MKYLIKIGKVLILIFVLFSIIPYLIPISQHQNPVNGKPFNESFEAYIDNIKLHYRMWTPTHENIKGKILLVHGLAASTFSWRNNVDFLKDNGYIVIAVDLPSFGYSDRRLGIEHSQSSRSTMLWKFLDSIDHTLNEDTSKLEWILVGHSMGGGTVSAMAMNEPVRTSRLILVDAAVLEYNPYFYSKLLYYPPFSRWIKIIFNNYLVSEKRIDALLKSAYGRIPTEYEIEGYLNPLKVKGTPDSMMDFIKTAKNEPLTELNNIDIPILGIWGEEDSWVPFKETAKIKTVVPKMVIYSVKGAKHCPMETHSNEFNNVLLQFIEK